MNTKGKVLIENSIHSHDRHFKFIREIRESISHICIEEHKEVNSTLPIYACIKV